MNICKEKLETWKEAFYFFLQHLLFLTLVKTVYPAVHSIMLEDLAFYKGKTFHIHI